MFRSQVALGLALICATINIEMSSCAKSEPLPQFPPNRSQVILVSCDGFRYDYLEWYQNETSFLRSLKTVGTHVKRMTPAFATKTFPNHWTMATGVSQDIHGILGNRMYDPKFNASFNQGTREERWWNAVLPIWLHAKQLGRKTATFFWPGSEVQIKGLRQDHFYDYKDSKKHSFENRVDKVLDWVTKEGIDLAVMYLDQPDAAGHNFGPRSPEVRAALKRVDDTIRRLFDGIKSRNYTEKVNVIIVSDHGMSDTKLENVINFGTTLDKYVDMYIESGPLFSVNPKPGKKQALIDYLNSQVTARNLSMRVFSKETLPSRFRYSKHRRSPEVLVLPDEGFSVITSRDKPPSRGNHGYDNHFSSMEVPVFAVGPSFKKNWVIDRFRQTDVSAVICLLLDIYFGYPNEFDRFNLASIFGRNDELAMHTSLRYDWLRHFPRK